jgi:branched-chain amino acid transport system ATP-binding protein
MSFLLDVRGITKTFSGLRALESVDLAVDEGSLVGVIGPNGAGKTTLFSVIAGELRPDVGSVRFGGRDITRWPAHRVARCGLVRTFQLMRPFETMTVLDNVAVAAHALHRRRANARAAAADVLARVGLDRYREQLAAELPTAALKRLELARGLALRPRLLLCDEVLAGLVPAERSPMIELLGNLRHDGLTLLFVEHVMAAVMALSDQVVVLHHGQLLASGSPEAVTKDQRVIDAYLGEEFSSAES